MPIRFATTNDISGLVEGGRKIHALSRLRHFDYDGEKVAQTFADLLERGKGKYVVLIAEAAGGEIVGALVGVLDQHIFSDRLVASIMHFDVLPERRMGGYGLRLFKAFEQWARNRKVAEINFRVNSDETASPLGRFVRKLGGVKVGENYVLGCG